MNVILVGDLDSGKMDMLNALIQQAADLAKTVFSSCWQIAIVRCFWGTGCSRKLHSYRILVFSEFEPDKPTTRFHRIVPGVHSRLCVVDGIEIRRVARRT